MKSKLSVLLAALLVLSVAGQATAFFEDFKLVRAVYSTSGTVEVLTDLGSISDLLTPGKTNLHIGTDFSKSLFGTEGYDKLKVSYFALDEGTTGTAPYQVWFSDVIQSPETVPVSGGNKYGAAQNAWNPIQGNYDDAGTAVVSGLKSDANSYFKKFDLGSSSAAGKFAGFYPSGSANGEALLTDLVTGGTVDQYLYYFTTDSVVPPALTGDFVASIRTYVLDGQIATSISTSTPAAVPVPAAVWLLGTGIIGLVGIRRRNR